MKIVITLIVVLALAFDAQCILNKAIIQSLLYRRLSATCRCVDKSDFCGTYASRCTTNQMMRVMCPVTCGLCQPCPDPPAAPTLTPGVEACEIGTCKDQWDPTVCAYHQERNRCFFYKNRCRATCGVCNTCSLPPETPEPCTDDCSDGHASCAFWKTRGFCDGSAYPHVRTVCKYTCEVCTPCPSTEEESPFTLPVGGPK